MGEFNLADMLRDVNARDLVQPGREQIQYIDIDLIDPDPKNFYELSDLDELSANIELVGLQQPLRVRAHPDDAGRWMIVSGHRRRAAIRQLVDEGKEDLRAVACIVEQPAANEALQELRLIFANSGTRKLTPAEVSLQAERTEMLFYELKEKYDMKFPGRMRDHVAEACKVSKSKLARLKVIRDNLDPGIKKYFDSGELAESPAYELAKLAPELQRTIFDNEVVIPGRSPEHALYAWGIKADAETYEKWHELKCVKTTDGRCSHADRILENCRSDHFYLCRIGKCCSQCSDLVDCKNACSMMAEKAKKLKAERKERRKKEKAAAAMTDAQEIAKVKDVWARFGSARAAAGKSTREVYDALGSYWTSYFEERDLASENGTGKFDKNMRSPYGPHVWELQKLIVIAEMFGVTTDYLLGRAETPQPLTATLESTQVWRSIETDPLPDEGDEVIVLHRMAPGAKLLAKIAYYRAYGFREREYGMVISGVVAWQPYHYEDSFAPDSDTETEREETDDD